MTGPAWEETAIARDIEAEKVSILADRSGVSIISNVAVSIILAISCSSYVELVPALSWVGLMGLVVTLRLWQVRDYRKNPNRISSENWLRRFAISAFVMGMVWALGILWFGSMAGNTELATIGFIVAGMTAGAAVFGAAHRLMATVYAVPMLAALLGILLSKPSMSHYFLALTVLLFGAGLNAILRQAEKSFEDASRRSFENEKLANRLSLALAREESAHAAQTQLVANVSHELRTPLGAVIGMIDLAREVSDAESRERFLCIAKESAGALQVMLNDLLEVSKLDLGHLELQMKPMNPADLMKSVGDLFLMKASDAGLEFKVNIDWPDGHLINADNNRVRQILVNLVGNALKFTGDGTVTLELEADVDEEGLPQIARFIVKDSGIGIPKSEQKRIFERFEQVNGASSRSHQGAGLGLAISKELSQAMGGDITVKSAPGNGARFTFTLPCQSVSQRETRSNVMAVVPVKKPDTDKASTDNFPMPHENIRVLVVDDNEINCVLISAILGQAKFDYETAHSGAEALMLLQKRGVGPFDVVLMDVQMPNMDGIETTCAIRALPTEVADVPIIAVTANAFKEQRTQCLKAGMQGFVVKPIEAELLVDEIRRVILEAKPEIITQAQINLSPSA